MPMPQVGDVAPAFSLTDQDGNTVQLSEHQGRNVLLYFYPKDDTPGCTREACAFRDDHAQLSQANAVVLGVSPDSPRSHKRFAEKYGLPFPLLADEGHQLAERYGVWVEKNMYGKKSMGIQRATFLIGPDGRVARVWPKVKVDVHAAEVREALGLAAPAQAAGPSAGEASAKAAPRKAASTGVRRTTASGARKTASKKTAAGRAPAKKAAAKKAPARKAAAKKAPAKKAAAKKTPARKAAGGRGGTASREAPRRAEGSADARHKTQVVARRGTMKPGANAPAGGVGPGVGEPSSS